MIDEELEKEMQEFAEQSETKKRFIEVLKNSDEEQREIMATVLLCAQIFGDDFRSELKSYNEGNDGEGLSEFLSKWNERLNCYC